jgi:hypothetical protein
MKKLSLIFLSFLFLISCSSGDGNTTFTDAESSNNTNNNWIVPTSDITGSDNPFPLALNPNYTLAKNVDFINDTNKVAILSFKNGEVYAYPYNYISTYEIINDEINGISFALTYCPITESAVMFKRDFNAEDSFILRSSGYLYKENLVAIDQKTNTYWSQLLLKNIKGKYKNRTLETLNLIETNWKTVKTYFPNALVFTNTSVQSNKTSQNASKISIDDNEVVYGVLEEITKNELATIHTYQYQTFSNGIELKTNKIGVDNILIVGDNDLQFITSFKVPSSSNSFTAIQNDFPNIIMDSNNNIYNVFGIAVSGPNQGTQLESPVAFAASFWAWKSFYPSIIEEI